jgi:hypothetical protein
MIRDGFVDVKDYGATGDGITNDYAAINAAIVTARGLNTRVFFPIGTYAYGTMLTLAAYDYLYGANMNQSVLKYTGTENAMLVNSLNILEHLTIQGTVAANNGIVVGPNDNGTRGIVSKDIFTNVSVTGFTRQGQISSAVAYAGSGGSGYDGTTALVFSAPSSGVTATGTPILSGGTMIGITLTNRGSGYTAPPTITTTGAGSGAVLRAYINATGFLINGGVTGTVTDCNFSRNWRNMLATYGALNTTWSFYDCAFSYTEGTQAYWNGGPAIQLEGMQSAIFNNTIFETCGEEFILIYSKYVENVVFNSSYYEQPNVAKRGNCVSLTGSSSLDCPIHITFNNDLIGFQPLYPLHTVNGYPSILFEMTEYVYSFDFAYACVINSPKFISENYYYSIYSGTNAKSCVFNSVYANDIHNVNYAAALQGIKVLAKQTSVPASSILYGITYSTITGPVYSLDSTTPSVSGNNVQYVFTNSVPTAVTTFLSAFEGQDLAVNFAENITSFDLSSATLFLKERNKYLIGATIVFKFVNSIWVEQYRNYVENHIVMTTGAGDVFIQSFNDAITQTLDVTVSGAINATGQISWNGGAHTATVVSDPSGFLANTATGGKVCFTWDTDRYNGFNSTGSALTIQTKLV